jgi:hypothetical protein
MIGSLANAATHLEGLWEADGMQLALERAEVRGSNSHPYHRYAGVTVHAWQEAPGVQGVEGGAIPGAHGAGCTSQHHARRRLQ